MRTSRPAAWRGRDGTARSCCRRWSPARQPRHRDSFAGVVIGELVGDHGRWPDAAGAVSGPAWHRGGRRAVGRRPARRAHRPPGGADVRGRRSGRSRSCMGVLREGAGWPLEDGPAQVEVDADGERLFVTAQGAARAALRQGEHHADEGRQGADRGRVRVRAAPRASTASRADRCSSTEPRTSGTSRGHGTHQRHPHGRRLHDGPRAQRARVARRRRQGHVRFLRSRRAGAPGRGASCRSSWPTPSPASRASRAPVYEVDFAPRKHRCDVLLNGSAHAPGGRPGDARRMSGLRVNGMSKTFAVVGDRVWQAGASGIARQHAAAVHGDADLLRPRVRRRRQHATRIRRSTRRSCRTRWAAASTSTCDPTGSTARRCRTPRSPGVPLSMPNDTKYRPMAFGPIGRGWEPRYKLRRHVRPEVARRTFPVPAARFRRGVLPGRTARSAGSASRRAGKRSCW